MVLSEVNLFVIVYLLKRTRAKHLESVLSQANNKKTVHPRINEERVAELKRNVLEADNGSQYHQVLSLDLSTVSPHISGTHFTLSL